MTPRPEPRPEPRIGDAERDAAVQALGEHYAAGRITKEEFDERSDRAMRARTDSDLRPLFADLPLLAPQAALRPVMGQTGGPRQPAPAWRQRVRLLPLVLVLIAVALATEAWWLFFVVWILFACRPHPSRTHHWPSEPSRRGFN